MIKEFGNLANSMYINQRIMSFIASLNQKLEEDKIKNKILKELII